MSAAHLAAATADTWGVSGPTFLGLYLAAGIAVFLLASLVFSRYELPAGRHAIDAVDLTPVQVALLAGSSAHAVAVSLAELRSRHLVDDDGAPTEAGTAPHASLLTKPTTELDAVPGAVLEALVASSDRPTPKKLAGHPAVRAALDAERTRLRAARLLTGRIRRGSGTLVVTLLVALVVLGIARIAAGSAHHKPVSNLVWLTLVALAATPLVVQRSRGARLSGAGWRALRQLRGTHLHLSPEHQPSWKTYGTKSMVLATALFGGGVMVAADPAFAEHLDLSEGRLSGGWSGSGSNSGSSSGGSCGGGSSCGGGGCGGGGCGG